MTPEELLKDSREVVALAIVFGEWADSRLERGDIKDCDSYMVGMFDLLGIIYDRPDRALDEVEIRAMQKLKEQAREGI